MTLPQTGCGFQHKTPGGGYLNCQLEWKHPGDHDCKLAETFRELAAMREKVEMFNEAVNIAQEKQVKLRTALERIVRRTPTTDDEAGWEGCARDRGDIARDALA